MSSSRPKNSNCSCIRYSVPSQRRRTRQSSSLFPLTLSCSLSNRGHYLGRFDKLRDEFNGNGEDDCRVLLRCDGTEGLRQEKLLLVYVIKIQCKLFIIRVSYIVRVCFWLLSLGLGCLMASLRYPMIYILT